MLQLNQAGKSSKAGTAARGSGCRRPVRGNWRRGWPLIACTAQNHARNGKGVALIHSSGTSMRRKNVQQQNFTTEADIRRRAHYWRNADLPPALVEVASARGVNCALAIFLELEIDFPGMPSMFGTLLTHEECFIEFAIETNASHSVVESVETWCDATVAQNLGAHNPGVGIGSGALAIKVLHELNAGV